MKNEAVSKPGGSLFLFFKAMERYHRGHVFSTCKLFLWSRKMFY